MTPEPWLTQFMAQERLPASYEAVVRDVALPLAERIAAAARPGGIVVGLVPGVLAEGVAGKRHAEFDEVEERARRERGLGERNVAMHAAAGEERLGERQGRIGFVARKPELVVRLLVGARVDGGAHLKPLGGDADVLDAQVAQLDGGVETRRSGTDDKHLH